MKNFIINIVITLSCAMGMSAAACDEGEKLIFDVTQIQKHEPSTRESFSVGINEENSRSIFCASFQKQSKSLDFVGVWHDCNPKSWTHRMVGSTFKNFLQKSSDHSKQALIIEGYPNIDGSGLLHHQFATTIEENTERYSEMELSFHLGLKHNIQVFTGEPKREETEERFVQNNFTVDDLFWLEIASYLEQAVRLKNEHIYCDTEDLQKIFQRFLTVCTKNTPESCTLDPRMNVEVFAQWMTQHFDCELTVKEFMHAMGNFDTSTYLGRLIVFAQTLRDHSLLARIQSCLRHYDHVMVVYGYTHYDALYQVLTDAMDKPTTYTCAKNLKPHLHKLK